MPIGDDLRAELEHYGTLDILGADAIFDTVADVSAVYRSRVQPEGSTMHDPPDSGEER